MSRRFMRSLSMIFTIASVAGAQGGTRDTVVRKVDRPLHPGVATLVEELSIGVADGAEEYIFGGSGFRSPAEWIRKSAASRARVALAQEYPAHQDRAADREPSKPTLNDVFEPDGRYLGQVQVPANTTAMVRRGDKVWAVAIGDDDVPRLKRYRIAWKN